MVLFNLYQIGENKGAHTFPKDIILKVNVIVWLEFEFAYYNVAVQHVNYYATETPPTNISCFLIQS